MMKHSESRWRGKPLRTQGATDCCNTVWDDLPMPMTDEERAREKAGLEKIDQLTAVYRDAERALERAREALHACIVEELRERNVAPGKIAAHTGYDRNHIRRIGNEAGVPPLRERTVRKLKD